MTSAATVADNGVLLSGFLSHFNAPVNGSVVNTRDKEMSLMATPSNP